MSVRMLSVVAASAIAIGLGAGAAAAQAAMHFEGTVVAKDKKAQTFSLKQDQGGGTVKFQVNDATKYERIAGFAAIKRGAKNIQVTARKSSNGRWIAKKVERLGKSGSGGGGGGGAVPPMVPPMY
jgi:hypothetical protein